MLNLTAEELDRMLNASDKKSGDLGSELSTIQSGMKQLRGKEAKIERDIEAQKNKSGAIKRAVILVQGVHSKISQTRNRLLKKMERVGREDTTIAESKKLGTEIETLKLEL